MFIDSLGGRQGSDEVVVVVKCVCGNDRKSGVTSNVGVAERPRRGSTPWVVCFVCMR